MTDWFDRELQMLNEQMIKQSVETLSKSDRGRQCLSDLYALMDNAVALDESGKNAALTLIASCWGGHAGTAFDAMRSGLGIPVYAGVNVRPARLCQTLQL